MLTSTTIILECSSCAYDTSDEALLTVQMLWKEKYATVNYIYVSESNFLGCVNPILFQQQTKAKSLATEEANTVRVERQRNSFIKLMEALGKIYPNYSR